MCLLSRLPTTGRKELWYLYFTPLRVSQLQETVRKQSPTIINDAAGIPMYVNMSAISTMMSAMVKTLLKLTILLIMAAPFPIHVKMYLKNGNCALTIKKLLLQYMVILPVT